MYFTLLAVVSSSAEEKPLRANERSFHVAIVPDSQTNTLNEKLVKQV